MHYYRLGDKDQMRPSWVLHEVSRPARKRAKRPEIPPVVYKVLNCLSPADSPMQLQYQRLCCKECGRYEEADVFDVGFSGSASIQIKGDFACSNDRVHLISDKFLRVLEKAKIYGYETKPIGSSGWHALRVTVTVDCKEDAVRTSGTKCPGCGRAERANGIILNLNAISPPQKSHTFFTTTRSWPRSISDRDIFITKEVVAAMKAGGIKGCLCHRLWTDEELRKAEEKAKKGISWKPPGMTIYF